MTEREQARVALDSMVKVAQAVLAQFDSGGSAMSVRQALLNVSLCSDIAYQALEVVNLQEMTALNKLFELTKKEQA